MSASIVSRDSNSVTIQVRIEFSDSMMNCEEAILGGVNEVGVLGTGEALKRFDTNGEPILVGGIKMTSKGLSHHVYQCPYGPVSMERHTYQSSRGGAMFCPVDDRARIVVTSTPRFAKMVSSKFAEMDTRAVIRDFAESNGRRVVLCFIQQLVDAVGAVALAAEEHWEYETPKLDVPVKFITIGVDGTCMRMCDGDFRQAMVGTLGLYDRHGTRMHTTYVGAAPEFGREKFVARMEKEIDHIKTLYPKALYIGLADGAKTNWDLLDKHTEVQVIDFYHATEYLTKVADVVFKKSIDQRDDWLDSACHRLKHELGAPTQLIKEMARFENSRRMSEANKQIIETSAEYFRKHKHQMPYARHTRAEMPIGSGDTEGACKVIIKERLCCSGMRWTPDGAAIVISLRCLTHTPGNWSQFWDKVNLRGYSIGKVSTFA